MQNQQLTPNQTTLQQSSNSLQPNNGGLQQSGTPSGSTDNSSILSQPLNADLQVQSTQTDPSLQSTYVPDQTGYGWVMALIVVLTIVVGFTLWKRLPSAVVAVEDELTPDVAEKLAEVTAKTPAKKAVKKPKYQKKTTRRQRARKP